MRLYTRKGDSGKTFLFRSSRRLSKSDDVFHLLGELDLLNSLLSLVRVEAAKVELFENLPDLITSIQELIFVVGSEVNLGDRFNKSDRIGQNEICQVECLIDHYWAKVGELKSFIIPGNSTIASLLHVARALTRQVERRAVKVKTRLKLRSELLAFLNRLSDLLFAMARYVDYRLSVEEKAWHLPDTLERFHSVCRRILSVGN
ncbi:MAG: cob(I)yrinic acid a,c-diamide adenosyltransferase [Nitrososphaerota archaeon]